MVNILAKNPYFFPILKKGEAYFFPVFRGIFKEKFFVWPLFSEKICAQTFQVSKFDRKRVFNARSAKFFQILPFKLLKIHEKGKKLLNNCKKYYQGRAYFFPVSLFFGCWPKYLPLASSWRFGAKKCFGPKWTKCVQIS